MSDNHHNFISIRDDIFHNVYGLIMNLLQLLLEQLHETSSVKAVMPSSVLFYQDNNGNDYFLFYSKFNFSVSLFFLSTQKFLFL
jgi:hypothetical protein